MTNRKPIYADAMPDARVISAPGGYWFPQKRVSHTAGCNRGWRRDKDNMLLGVEGYDVMKMLRLSKHKRRRAMQEFPHRDPWANISTANLSRTEAILIAFGPKVAYQTNLIV